MSFLTRRCGIATLLLLMGISVPNASAELLGIDWTSATLWRVNTLTGAATSIGPTGLNSPIGIAFSPSGILYAMAGSSTAESLYTINPSTGASTLVAAVTGLSGVITQGDIAFSSNGTLYGVEYTPTGGSDLDLFSINTTTGAGTFVTKISQGGPPYFSELSAMAFDSSGNLWVYDQGFNNLDELTSNVLVFSESLSVSGTGSTAGMSFNPANGTLYIATGEGTTNLYTANTSTGVMTLVGSTGENMSGLAFTPTPEPSTFLLILMVTGAGAISRRFIRI